MHSLKIFSLSICSARQSLRDGSQDGEGQPPGKMKSVPKYVTIIFLEEAKATAKARKIVICNPFIVVFFEWQLFHHPLDRQTHLSTKSCSKTALFSSQESRTTLEYGGWY